MFLERERHLRTEPRERTDERYGYANGCKEYNSSGHDRTSIPQVCGSDETLWPASLDGVMVSEKALCSAEAEMTIHGIGSRRVKDTHEALGGSRSKRSMFARQLRNSTRCFSAGVSVRLSLRHSFSLMPSGANVVTVGSFRIRQCLLPLSAKWMLSELSLPFRLRLENIKSTGGASWKRCFREV